MPAPIVAFLDDGVETFTTPGNGTGDDQAAIQSALTAAAACGGRVYVPPGTYAIGRPLTIPANVELTGSQGLRVYAHPGSTPPTDAPAAAKISLLPTFDGAAGIVLTDKDAAGNAVSSSGQRISHLNLDCSAVTGATASTDGLLASGRVHDVSLDHVWIWTAPRHGINTTGGHPYSWSMTRVTVASCGSIGFFLNKVTDTTMIECQAIHNGSAGISLVEFQNGHLIGCRAEWNGASGFTVNGAWGTAETAGGMTMTGCSTDRNNGSGLSVTATGPGPLIVTGCMFRRDGKDSNGKGVSLSGTTMPVIINGMTVLPGVSDDTAPPDSPLIGLAVSGCTYVVVDNAYIHAVQTPISDGGSNGVFQQVGVYTATGPTTSPVRQAPAAVRTAVTLIGGTAAETAVHTFTVRANSALAGWMYKLVAWGTASAKGTPTLTFRLRAGGPTGKIVGSVAVTVAAGASDRTWRMEGEVAVKGVGANANWHGVLTVLSDLPAAPVARSNASVDNTQVDTTVDQDLVLTVQWGTADAGNTLYCPAAYAQRIMGS